VKRSNDFFVNHHERNAVSPGFLHGIVMDFEHLINPPWLNCLQKVNIIEYISGNGRVYARVQSHIDFLRNANTRCSKRSIPNLFYTLYIKTDNSSYD
jgi:hypothetical protein